MCSLPTPQELALLAIFLSIIPNFLCITNTPGILLKA